MLSETVDEKTAHAAARNQNSRATEGTKKTIVAKGKIGGEFTITPNPPFLGERLAIFEKLKAKHEARVAAMPHEPITVVLPDGKPWYERF